MAEDFGEGACDHKVVNVKMLLLDACEVRRPCHDSKLGRISLLGKWMLGKWMLGKWMLGKWMLRACSRGSERARGD